MSLGKFSPTLINLVLIGFALVALPLVLTIVTAVVQVDGFAKSSQASLLAVQANTAQTRVLSDRVLEMERSARQYQALGDDTYRALFHDHQIQVTDLIAQLRAATTLPEVDDSLGRALDLAENAKRDVEALKLNPQEDIQTGLSALREQVTSILQAQIARDRALAEAMPEHARSLQGLLLSQAALVIPLSVGLAGVFAVLIWRPLRQLDAGIRTLGRGSLGEPIDIRGSRDIAELGLRLDWLRIRLAELEAQKSQFLRNVSHELKTPLTNIREAVELLAEEANGQGEEASITEILRNNSIRLQKMIEQLLQFGADGDITERVSHVPVQLHRLVEQALELHTAAIHARDITIRSDLQPAAVRGSVKHLQVIIDNLLSNAFKYTATGGLIQVRVVHRGSMVELHVQDDGPGVRDIDAPRLYDWFFSGPKPRDSIVAGTGMGLAIAQEYAQQHEGDIRLLPSEKGAHFRLTLPSVGQDNE